MSKCPNPTCQHEDTDHFIDADDEMHGSCWANPTCDCDWNPHDIKQHDLTAQLSAVTAERDALQAELKEHDTEDILIEAGWQAMERQLGNYKPFLQQSIEIAKQRDAALAEKDALRGFLKLQEGANRLVGEGYRQAKDSRDELRAELSELRARVERAKVFAKSVIEDYENDTSHLLAILEGDEKGNLSSEDIVPYTTHHKSERAKLVEEIMRKADILSDEGSPERAASMYDVGKYILTGSWEW